MEAIIKSSEHGVSANMQLSNFEVKEVTHTATNIYVECTNDVGWRFTLCLSEKEAAAISEELVRKSNDDWIEYKKKMGEAWEREQKAILERAVQKAKEQVVQ